VIQVFETRAGEPKAIFVAGGFAEVTPDRLTVLAEEALPVADIDRAALDQQIQDLGEDLADAKDEAERSAVETKLAVAKAKKEALAA
jgi:F-type H+-transporting ATPase subunit epsilon